jgi:cyanophycin synthetase
MIKKDKNTKIILQEAKKLGLKAEIIYPERQLIELSKGSKKILILRNFRINLSRFDNKEYSLFKDLSYFFWQKNNIPIPKTITVFSFREAKRGIKKIPLPLVIKDAQASRSKNLWANLSNLKKTFSILKNLFSSPFIKAVIIQEFVQGKEFRILVLKNRILGIAQLIPPVLIGNNRLTIKRLIKELERKIKCQIVIDQEMKDLIKKQGFSFNSILPANQKLFLREYSKVKEGGQIKNLSSDSLHPEIKKMCLKAVKVVGLELAGLDIIAENLSKSPKEQKIKFIEINGRPDVYIHHYPNEGQPVNVTREILKHIFEL